MRTRLQIVLLLTATCSCLDVFAQEVIILNSGERVEAKVISIDSEYVHYIDNNQSDSIAVSVPVFQVAGIRYADNTIQVLTPPENFQEASSVDEKEEDQKDMRQKGKEDSRMYYHAVGSGAGSIKVATLVATPFLGFIPTITCAATMPRSKKMNFPDEELLCNEEYKNAYRKEAHRTKRRAVWSAYGTSTGQWFEAIGKAVLFVITLPTDHFFSNNLLSDGSDSKGTVNQHRNNSVSSTPPHKSSNAETSQDNAKPLMNPKE